ncbi:MAG TPA: Holliday junction resolvase RuvX [Patescibacteria group bacterium]|jgi:putative Holliday junction resolvase|nr:Holliday junction resolvase RuvX [Patescibacteria group bacterium]
MRILALDWGTKRVGLAVSDEGGKIAFALDKPIDSKGAISEIKQLVQKLEVGLILIGLPKNLKGEEASSAKKLKSFADDLLKAIGIPLNFIDERFTSVEAGKKLDEQGIREKDQRGIKDNIAAQLMLQQYLDTKK